MQRPLPAKVPPGELRRAGRPHAQRATRPPLRCIEIDVPAKLFGTLAALRLRNRFGVQALLSTDGGKIEISPAGDFELRAKDKVVLIGSNAAVDGIRDYLSE